MKKPNLWRVLTRASVLSAAFAALNVIAQTTLPLAEGEVRRVMVDTGKISIKHGEIKNLDMPPMSMVFVMKEPAMLEKVKAGDKVKFSAENINGVFTVTHIEMAQ